MIKEKISQNNISKQRISQSNINRLSKFQGKLQQLSQIQADMYDRISRNQKHHLNQLQEMQQTKKRCLKQRPNNIKAQTFEQIVKHPYNGDQVGGNRCWKFLANFVNQQHDLDQVQKRMMERKLIRDEIEKEKREQKQRQQLRLKKQREEQEWKDGLFAGRVPKRGKNSKKAKQTKIPFSLQRQLHRKEVQQNKKRLQKMQQYKRQTYYQAGYY